MGTVAERLKQARELAGFAGPREAADALGMNRFTYTQHENGTRGFRRDSTIKYSRRFKVSLEWLETGKGTPRGAAKSEIPVTSYVGAGAEITPFPDQGALDYIPAPPGFEDCEAAELRGDSMPPLQAGWRIVWRRGHEGVTAELIGKLCIVQVQDGPTLVKILRKARKKGFWDLESWNAPRRENVSLVWAAKIVDIRPD